VGSIMQDAGLARDPDRVFADLMSKHHRPRTLKDALERRPRQEPANENRPPKRRGS
jgi:hypothetical protein